jgi:uncharacterized protein YbcI
MAIKHPLLASSILGIPQLIFSLTNSVQRFDSSSLGVGFLHSFATLRECLVNSMKTQGEIEAAICDGISRFEQEFMGRGPKDIRAYLLGDLLVVRLQGVLTAAEQHLVKTLPAEKGRDLLKQVRTHLVETARPLIETMIQEITGSKVVSLHHDISTLTGEEVVLFTLAQTPQFRDLKKK